MPRCLQILERSDDSKYKSRGFETLRDFTIRRLIGYWNGAQMIRNSHCHRWHSCAVYIMGCACNVKIACSLKWHGFQVKPTCQNRLIMVLLDWCFNWYPLMEIIADVEFILLFLRELERHLHAVCLCMCVSLSVFLCCVFRLYLSVSLPLSLD